MNVKNLSFLFFLPSHASEFLSIVFHQALSELAEHIFALFFLLDAESSFLLFRFLNGVWSSVVEDAVTTTLLLNRFHMF